MNGIKIYTAGEMTDIPYCPHPHDMIFSDNWRTKIEYLFDELDEININWNHPGRVEDHSNFYSRETVNKDIELICDSDFILAYLNRSQLDGTLVELTHAAQLNKPIFLIDAMPTGSYWFILEYLRQILTTKYQRIQYTLNWMEGGILKNEDMIRKKFLSFLESNGFILKNYKEYITSDDWKQKSRVFREEHKGVCSLCDTNVGVKGLRTHHKQYPKNFKQDSSDNWIAICDVCHKKIHGVI